MQRIALIVMAGLLCAWHPVLAVTIGADQSAGMVPMDPGTGLLGSYYKFNTGYLTSLNQANQLIASSGGPTATFMTTTVCFPNCNVSTVTDASTSLMGLLNGNITNFAYGVPISQIPTTLDHSAMTISGYIAITEAGNYNFNVGSDDSAQLTIGNQVIIASTGIHSFLIDTGSATFAAAGLYAIKLQYFENNGYTGLELWASNGAGNCIIGRGANCSGTVATSLFYSSAPTSAPEPGTIAMFSVGIAGLVLVARQRRA
jgi:hypothetical protein